METTIDRYKRPTRFTKSKPQSKLTQSQPYENSIAILVGNVAPYDVVKLPHIYTCTHVQ